MSRFQSPASVDDIDIAALWQAIVARRAFLSSLILFTGVVTYLLLQLVTPIYTSQARVLIEHEEPTFMRPMSETTVVRDRRVLLDQEAVASQVQILLSRDLAYEVVKDLKLEERPEFGMSLGPSAILRNVLMAVGLAKPPAVSAREERALDKFASNLNVYRVAKSRVIAVEFDSSDARLAADVANRLSEAYLTWQRKEKLRQTRDASAWLTEQIDALRQRVKDSEGSVEAFRGSSGLIAGSNNITLDAQQLSELNSQLILAKAQRTEAEARASLIRRMLKEKGDVAASPDVLSSPLIQRLLEQRVRVRRQLAELSATLLSSHPRMRQLRAELADLRRQIRREAEKVVSSLRNEAEIAGAREKSLRESLDELKQRTSEAGESQIKLRALEREAKASRDLLESYLARQREANARRDESSVPAHASIISRAHVPRKPSFPLKAPMSVLAAAVVGLLSLAWIAVRELTVGGGRAASGRRQPVVPAAHHELLNVNPAVGSHPIASGGASAISNATAAGRLIAGKCGGGAGHSVIMASQGFQADSATATLDTARAVARSGLSVAIVDFSLADAGVDRLIGTASVPGLGELLGGWARFEDVVSADPASPVQLIPAGTLNGGLLSAEQRTRWVKVHDALRQTYDCILCHTSLSGARDLLPDLGAQSITLVVVTAGMGQGAYVQQTAQELSQLTAASLDVRILDAPRPQHTPAPQSAFGREAPAV